MAVDLTRHAGASHWNYNSDEVDAADAWINARFYGVVGDGVTDDTAALNAAIAATVGRILVVSPGTYKTSSTIILPDDTTIFAYGATLVPIDAGSFPAYAALNTAVDNPGGFGPSSRPILSNEDPAGGNTNIRIYGLGWTGNVTGSTSMHGLHVHKVTGLTIENCITVECLSPIAILQSQDVIVAGNRISGFRNGGIDTWTGCKRVLITKNLIDCTALNSDGTNHGIFVTSEPTDGAGDAANYQAEDYVVSGNIIVNAESHGIWVGGGDASLNRVNDLARRVRVEGNIIRDADGVGIILERSEDCVLDGNTLVNIGHHGIFTRKNVSSGTAYVDRPTICNNQIRNVGLVTADSKFIHMDDTTRDAFVVDNQGSGSAHTYALYDRATNSGLVHHGNMFASGTSGVYNILSTNAGEFAIAGGVLLAEMAEPAAPSTNQARFYVKDNGSGKSQLCVRFPTGAVQVIATEP
jgi:parallel beta-helix repeat protein